MEKDLNNEQSVATQDLNNADAVSQQDLQNDSVNQTQSDGTLADGTDPNKPIPYSKAKEMAESAKRESEEARKKAEEETAHAQRQLELIQANAQGQQQAQQTTQQARSTYEQAMQEFGLTADDLYGENLLKVQNRKAELDIAFLNQRSAVNANQQFIASHPDINIVGSVNPASGLITMPSAELSKLLAKKPYLAQATLPALYDAVKEDKRLVELEAKVNANTEHTTRVDTNTQPLGGSAAGGGGAGDIHEPMMTREQVREIDAKLEAGEEV